MLEPPPASIPTNTASRTLSWICDVLLLLAVCLAAWSVSARIDQWMDLHLDDESMYLGKGSRLAKEGFQGASWGPLYSGWYWLVGTLATFKPLTLYYLNQRLIILALPACFFVALRSLKVQRWVAFFAAWFLAVSDLNVRTLPKVGHFAAVVLLTTVAVAGLCRPGTARRTCMMLGVFTAAYVRPEYLMAVGLLATALVLGEVRGWWRKQRSRGDLWLPGAALVLMGVICLRAGVPVGSRSFVAFSQHFGLNWVVWHPEAKLNPWTDTDVIISSAFGSAHSVSAAFLANPAAFTSHILINAVNIGPELGVGCFSHNPVFGTLANRSRLFESIVLLVAGVLILAPVLVSSFRLIRTHARLESDRLGGLAAAVAAALTAATVIHPDPHYLIAAAVCVAALALPLVARVQEGALLPAHALLLCGVAVLVFPLVTPSAAPAGRASTPELDLVRLLRSLPIDGKAVLLAPNTQSFYLLGKAWKLVPSWKKGRDENFLSFIRKNGITVIASDERMTDDSRYRDDKEWQAFWLHCETAGFRIFPSNQGSSPSRVLFVREDVLPSK